MKLVTYLMACVPTIFLASCRPFADFHGRSAHKDRTEGGKHIGPGTFAPDYLLSSTDKNCVRVSFKRSTSKISYA